MIKQAEGSRQERNNGGFFSDVKPSFWEALLNSGPL